LYVVFLTAACSSTPKTYGPVYDGGEDAPSDDATTSDASTTDATADAAPSDATSDAPSCASTIAIVGGSATSLFAGTGAQATSVTGDLHDCGNDFGCADPIAIARVSNELVAVLARTSGTLQSTTYQSTWPAPANVASASTIDGPSLATIGGVAHLVFQGADYKYLHAQYTLNAWDSAADPVGGSGSSQSYGARAPSAAAAGTDLVVVQAGSDSYLYDQTWNGSWQAAHQQGGAAIQNTLPPTIVALAGGASELLAVYLRETDYKVMAVARTSGTWGTPMLVDANAYSNDPVAAGALPNGKALVVFRGSDKKPYFSTWDGASTWSAPAAMLGASNPSIESTPSIAAGVCGADAIVAFVETGSGAETVPFASGTFGAPTAIAGTSGAKFVAVGTLP
jgi:hypothetical protein